MGGRDLLFSGEGRDGGGHTNDAGATPSGQWERVDGARQELSGVCSETWSPASKPFGCRHDAGANEPRRLGGTRVELVASGSGHVEDEVEP
ncbi:MAG TPA: hypothetical protein VFG85_05795, partial [Gaiellaceae bacterium]|nr:hypothetical protein [Gaiellaceae bacterium]